MDPLWGGTWESFNTEEAVQIFSRIYQGVRHMVFRFQHKHYRYNHRCLFVFRKEEQTSIRICTLVHSPAKYFFRSG